MRPSDATGMQQDSKSVVLEAGEAPQRRGLHMLLARLVPAEGADLSVEGRVELDGQGGR